jgi:CTP:phosphocholine cytidylyltransferase-like protein
MTDILIICPEITKGMKSSGSRALLPLKNKLTLIEHQIKQLRRLRPSDITINVGFEAEKIQQKLQRYKSVRYLLNKEYKTTNQAKNLIEYIHVHNPKDLLIISSGVVIKNNFIYKKHLTGHSKVFVLPGTKNNFDIGCSPDKELKYLFYGMMESWTEIFYLNSLAIDKLKRKNKFLFDQMYLFEIINLLTEDSVVFDKIYTKKTDIMKIQNIKDLKTAKKFI